MVTDIKALLAKRKQELAELKATGVGYASVQQKIPPAIQTLTLDEPVEEKKESKPSVALSDCFTETLDPMCPASLIRDRIRKLRHNLNNNIPGFDNILREIHVSISKDPETVHLLKEEEIGIIVSGLCKRKDIILVENKPKSKSKKEPLTAEEL